MIAVITSCVSTCTVWTNNILKKSNLLLFSSLITFMSHILCIVAIYLRIFLGPPLAIETAPIIHCFTELDLHNTTYLISGSDSNWRTLYLPDGNWYHTIRLCTVDEQPYFIFAFPVDVYKLYNYIFFIVEVVKVNYIYSF